jgi:palmitoyltransferase ZDHHC13/17
LGDVKPCITLTAAQKSSPAPIFGKRENGSAMLGGEVINYTSLYETPLGIGTRTRRGRDTGGSYESVAADDSA